MSLPCSCSGGPCLRCRCKRHVRPRRSNRLGFLWPKHHAATPRRRLRKRALLASEAGWSLEATLPASATGAAVDAWYAGILARCPR